MDDTKEKIVRMQESLGQFFREEIARILKDIQNIEGKIIEINAEIAACKKRQEIFRYQEHNQTRDVFSPFAWDKNEQTIYQQQLEQLTNSYIVLREQSVQARERLTFFRERGIEIKEIGTIVSKMTELEINQKNDIIKEIDINIMPQLMNIKAEAKELEINNRNSPGQVSAKSADIEKAAEKIEQSIQNIENKLLQGLIQFL